jgi:hypothetical protein
MKIQDKKNYPKRRGTFGIFKVVVSQWEQHLFKSISDIIIEILN